MTARPRLSMVAARAANGVIGRDGVLPWRISSDLKHFRSVTMGKPVVMGRKTWDSIGAKALPGRSNIVISRDPNLRTPQAAVFADVDAALASAYSGAQSSGAMEVCVIGGAALYRLLFSRADRLYLTEVDATPEGDAFFPPFVVGDFVVTDKRASPSGPKDEFACTFLTLDRKVHQDL